MLYHVTFPRPLPKVSGARLLLSTEAYELLAEEAD